ncbi:MAG: DUF3299 domain-containing protein [Planctomycetes bacterium]|nr:DUF3299 domain-containing protein [Planctomycetota bacterium]
MRGSVSVLAGALSLLMACGGNPQELGPAELPFEGAPIDSAVEKSDDHDPEQAPPVEVSEAGFRKLGFPDLSLEELGKEGVEDLLDSLLYPEERTEGDLDFPPQVKELDQTQVGLRGYMIPSVQENGAVTEFLLVADLLSCCFGGSPAIDQWVNVKMVEGRSCEYFAYVPVRVNGLFRIEVIEGEDGYASGCFHIDAVEVDRDF